MFLLLMEWAAPEGRGVTWLLLGSQRTRLVSGLEWMWQYEWRTPFPVLQNLKQKWKCVYRCDYIQGITAKFLSLRDGFIGSECLLFSHKDWSLDCSTYKTNQGSHRCSKRSAFPWPLGSLCMHTLLCTATHIHRNKNKSQKIHFKFVKTFSQESLGVAQW